MVYPKCRTHPCPPNEKHPPDSRTGDPELLGAKCRITPKFPNEDAPIDNRNRAPKAHTKKYQPFPLRARPLGLRKVLISRQTPGGLLRRTSPSWYTPGGNSSIFFKTQVFSSELTFRARPPYSHGEGASSSSQKPLLKP
jgi:hypothetical protein